MPAGASTWNQRVQEAFDHPRRRSGQADPGGTRHRRLPEQIRPAVYACVESYARRCAQRPCGSALVIRRCLGSIRSPGYATAGTDIAPPENLSTIVSVLMAVIDGLMIQWIADPSATPRSTEVIRSA